MGILGSLLGAIPGVGQALGIGGTILGAISGSKAKDKASKLQQQAVDLKLGDYNANAPLRDKARQLAMSGMPQRPQLGAIFQDSGNPYNKAGSMVSQLYNGGAAPPPQPLGQFAAVNQSTPPIDPQALARQKLFQQYGGMFGGSPK